MGVKIVGRDGARFSLGRIPAGVCCCCCCHCWTCCCCSCSAAAASGDSCSRLDGKELTGGMIE